MLGLQTAPLRKFSIVLQNWFKDLKNLKENFLTWLVVLIFYIEDRNVEVPEIEYEDVSVIKEWLKSNDKTLVLDDYVYDMHTKVGKRDKTRGTTEYFVLESSRVEPIDPICNYKYRHFYECFKLNRKFDYKEVDDEVKVEANLVDEKTEAKDNINEFDFVKAACHLKTNEKDCFEFRARCQINTSNNKTDTYFAYVNTDIGKINVFVKGPVKDKKYFELMIERNNIKKDLGFKVSWMFIVYLEVDKTINSPLGLRNKFSAEEYGYYLVCEDLIGIGNAYEDIKTVEKISKKWPSTQVVDFSKYKNCKFTCGVFNNEINLQYVLLLIYRDIFQITDHADRNFIVDESKNIVYSLDEDCKPSNSKLNSLPKNKKSFILDIIKAQKDEIQKILEDWKQKNNKCNAYFEGKKLKDIKKLFS